MATPLLSSLSLSSQNPNNTLRPTIQQIPACSSHLSFEDIAKLQYQPSLLYFGGKICSSSRNSLRSISSTNISSGPSKTRNYEVKLGNTSISSGRSNRHPLLGNFFTQKINFVDPPLGLYLKPRDSTRYAQWLTIPSATNSDKAASEPCTTDFVTAETATTANQPPSPPIQPGVNGKEKASAQVQNTVPKKSPLTAREKLRAARVLSRYTESKPAKTGLGSKVLDALRESDGGKRRSGLPQAPTNLFDDSKRGMPKQGLTFDLPGGSDLFFIALSVILISTIMFTTTYIVWKVGAIHFNEY